MEPLQAGAYWAGREESAEQCARRAERFFHLLGRCDAAYGRWFEHAYSRRQSLRLPFEPTYETFLRFFGRKKYRLGKDAFHFEAWTGQEQRGRGGMLSFTCGSGTSFYPNGCLLYLPREEPAAGRVLTVSVLKEVLRAMVLAWEPDGCSVVSEDAPGVKDALVAEAPCVGWLTYVSRRLGKVPRLPRPVRVEPLEGKGSLVILTRERFCGEDRAHLALVEQVRLAFVQAGLMP
jgi:hypothetical protein